MNNPVTTLIIIERRLVRARALLEMTREKYIDMAISYTQLANLHDDGQEISRDAARQVLRSDPVLAGMGAADDLLAFIAQEAEATLRANGESATLNEN